MSLYLGLDSSTQSLTGIVIEIAGSRRRIVFRRSVSFDEDFPEYGTRNGVLAGGDPAVATSSPVLWAEALDRMMEALAAESDVDVARLRAVSGAAQQHGSVYLCEAASETLAHLDPSRPIAGQVRGMLSRDESPIWMDSSTATQCRAIADAVGGEAALGRLTGSRAFERFTGPQIRKFREVDPSGYSATDRIHLVSSFLASLLVGAHAPIEPGDGAGMNLMDIAHGRWAPEALAATAPGLARRLPALTRSWSVIGQLAPYWVERHGFPPADVVAWTGDNPSSLVGVGLVDPDRIGISLGTSDTVFGLLRDLRIDPSGASHVFGAPTGDYMALVCFRNGSLARERVLREHGLDWHRFASVLDATPPGNRGAIMLPWFEPEITPPVARAGVRRYGLEPSDTAANVRAVIEAQMMATAIHSDWIGTRARVIHATGGAACNRDILRIMADVHDAEVHRFEVSDSAALGAALRAYHGSETAAGRHVAWQDVVEGFVEPVPESRIRPDPRNASVYAGLKPVYAACEAHALGAGPDPAPLLDAFRSKYPPDQGSSS